jgi:hypothetical protein
MTKMLFIPIAGEMTMVDCAGLEGMRQVINPDEPHMLIERVRVGIDWSLAIDEAGLYHPPVVVNPRASRLYGYEQHGQPIVGNALLAKESFVGGGVDWVDTDEEEARAFIDNWSLS